ncbi:MAG: S-layer homology domain-containing protein [Pseudoflavonifractor capillosus]|uniref:Ig-like domain-containing protein n=1 Tax=Pseudoflavonifractor capillosus TaxID=106588 RepID=UPI0023F868AE|nr:Ig-like domain-containing protein [Pseudoflavonifractor capillosus]MCI5927270.1 S-layer homology domain-containing protein [Pseudoflavonifractor capillosus]
MKHRAFLRRSLPLLSLTVLLLTFALPTYALFGIGEEAEAPLVAAFSKNGPAGSAITFSAEDFVVQSGGALDSIVISTLPDQAAGILTLGGQPLNAGDVVAMNAVSGLSFQPLTASAVTSASFTFTPVFSDGTSGSPVEVGLHLLSEANSAPIAENLELCTYKNVAITASFAATDPEGDLLTFQLVDKPARGAVTMPEDGSNEFVYTPYENKTGKDSFTYVAVDAVGNTSAPATVKVKIEKASTKVTYSDMDGVSAHKAAIRLAEEGIFVGECMGGEYFFNPDTPVSRSEFLTMTMKATGLDALEDVTTTGFADDAAIPTWAKGYAASALKAGVVQGAADEVGRIVFNAEDTITRAEAAVLLDRALQVSDVSETMATVDELAPAWAVQSAANLESCGVLAAGSTGTLELSDQLTRADAAEMILGALEVLDARDSGGWFNW